jgi:N-acetylglucosamine kinase-like BadF-type ATPase
MLQIGGLGFITGDKGGGGGYMGARLLSAVYGELFRKGEPTIMTSYLFEKLGITSKYDYVEKVSEEFNNGTFNMHKCGIMVFEAVKRNDNVASDILREIADSYANGISCMIDELQFPADEELDIMLAGSVFIKGEHPLLVDSLKEKVSNDNPSRQITYNLLNVPNVAGAVIWAFNILNNKNDYYKKICSQLPLT